MEETSTNLPSSMPRGGGAVLSWGMTFLGGFIWFQVFRFGVFGFSFFFCVGLVSGLFFVFDLLGIDLILIDLILGTSLLI